MEWIIPIVIFVVLPICVVVATKIVKRQRKKTEYINFLNSAEPIFHEYSVPIVECVKPLENWVNKKFREFIVAKNNLDREEQHLDWLKRRREAQDFLHYKEQIDETEEQIASSIKQCVELQSALQKAKFNPFTNGGDEVKAVFNKFKYIKAELNRSGKIEAPFNQFIENSSWSVIDSTCYLYFCPYYIMLAYSNTKKIKIIPFSDLKVKADYKIVSYDYGQYVPSEYETSSIHWLHEKQRGGPDLRYSYNPSKKDVYVGVLRIMVEGRTVSKEYKTRFDANKVAKEIEDYIKLISGGFYKTLVERMFLSSDCPNVQKIIETIKLEQQKEFERLQQLRKEQEQIQREREERDRQTREEQRKKEMALQEERRKRELALQAEQRRIQLEQKRLAEIALKTGREKLFWALSKIAKQREKEKTEPAVCYLRDKFGRYDAVASYSPPGMRLWQGSKIDLVRSYPGMPTQAIEIRANRELVDANGILLDDVYIQSVSSAAKLVLGYSDNGWNTWKLKSGLTLKQHIDHNPDAQSIAQQAETSLKENVYGKTSKTTARSSKARKADSQFWGLSDEEKRVIIEMRKEKERLAREEEIQDKKNKAEKLLATVAQSPIDDVEKRRVITNSIVNITFIQSSIINGCNSYKLYFIDELGDIISNHVILPQKNINETTKVRFELKTTNGFNSNKQYYLLVVNAEDDTVLGKLLYKINITFSNDFGF